MKKFQLFVSNSPFPFKKGLPYTELLGLYNTVKKTKMWTDITSSADTEVMEARHISCICALIKEIQTHYEAGPEEKPAAWAALLKKAAMKGYITSVLTMDGPPIGPHGPAPAAPPAHAPAIGPTPEPQCVTHTPALPTPRTIPYVLVPRSDMSATSCPAINASLPKNMAPKQMTPKQVAPKQVAPKAGHGLPTLEAKAPHPVPHTLPKPPQHCPKQGKDGPPPPHMDINKEPCKRCMKKKMYYIHIGKDGKEGACYACNTKKVSCHLVLKGKGKVQDNKAAHKGKGKVVLPAYVVDTKEEDKQDKEDKDKVEVVKVAPVHSIIPLDPQLAPRWPSAPAAHQPSAPAAQSSGDQCRLGPQCSAGRAVTLGPSNDPLLSTPPPSGGVQPNQGWYQQMVDYVAEVNAQNSDKQGRLDGLIKGLGKHAHGDGIREDVNRRIANLEQSTREGFARIGERLKAIWDCADTTTHCVNDMERRLTELEAIPSAPPVPQDDRDETRESDTKVKVSNVEDEVPGAPQLATPGSAPAAQAVTIVMEPEIVSEGIWVEQLKAEANTDTSIVAKSIGTTVRQ
ncbi:hypothetical protein DXG01_015043 [Tephrocybe rancida]|nr:hypothetical protein DXG01_015043 [Tephrocybe rancida]